MSYNFQSTLDQFKGLRDAAATILQTSAKQAVEAAAAERAGAAIEISKNDSPADKVDKLALLSASERAHIESLMNTK